MAGSSASSFPLVIAVRQDGGVAGTVKGIETAFDKGWEHVGSSGENAARRAQRAFDFSATRRDLDGLKRSMDSLGEQRVVANADPFGVKASIAALRNNPLQAVLAEQAAAETSLAQQRARYTAERIAGIQREFDASMASIRDQQAARSAAFANAETEGRRLIGLDQQRAAEAAKLVAAPQATAGLFFDPAGAQAAATAARAQATALDQVARASQSVVASGQAATASDRALAASARDAAAAADFEANRLEALAATQAKVGAAAAAAGVKLAGAADLARVSASGQRQAYIQAGQQVQDFAIQVQAGQSPLVAFTQQASQMAYVLGGAGGKVGAVANFFAGPWGAALLIGSTVLVPLISRLLDTEEAAGKAKAGVSDLATYVGNVGNYFDQATGRIKETNQALIQFAILSAKKRITEAQDAQRTARREGDAALAASVRRPGSSGFARSGIGDLPVTVNTNVQDIIRSGRDVDARLQAIASSNTANATAAAKILEQRAAYAKNAVEISKSEAEVKSLLSGKLDASLRTATGGGSNRTTRLDQQAKLNAATTAREAAEARLNLTRTDGQAALTAGTITEAEYTRRVTAGEQAVNRAEAAERAASAARRDGNAARREAVTLANQQQEAEQQIANIAGRFDAAPRLVDQSASAVRQLDEIIAKYGALHDATSLAIVDKAKLARASAESAPVTQITLATEELRDQLRVAELAATGREVEAAQLQDKLALLKRIGVELGKQTPAQDAAIANYGNTAAKLAQAQFNGRFNTDERAAAQEADALRAELQGRQDIADLIRTQAGYEANGQKLTEAQTAALQRRLATEFDLTREKERQAALIEIQVRAAQELQGALTEALTAPFAKGTLGKFVDSLTGIRQRRVAEELSIKLIGGDLGSKVHDALTRNGQPLSDAAKAHLSAAAKWDAVADKIGARLASNDNPTLAQITTTPTAYGGAAAAAARAIVAGDPEEITVSNKRAEPYRAISYDDRVRLGVDQAPKVKADLNHRLTTALTRYEAPLTLLASGLRGRGAAFANSALNIPEYKKLGDTIGESLGGKLGLKGSAAVAGAGQGLAADAAIKLLGLKGSKRGGAIGGAIGGATGIPGGALIGGALGSIVGGLFKKTKTGSATITSVDGGVSTSGNSAGLKASSSQAAVAVQDQLQRIISTLGGTAGSFSASIGQRKGNFVVDTNGTGRTKGAGTLSFKTEAEAARALLLNAIQDGAVAGIREGAQRLLRAGADIDRQLQKAVDFQGEFTELKQITDPTGAAIDALDKQFTYLRTVFAEASASAEEYADLEKLYGLKRAEAIKSAAVDLTSTLQSLLDDLRFKGDAGLSLRTRETNAAATFDPLAAKVRAGEAVDQTEFADAAKTSLDIARQLYGSTQVFFDRLAEITALTGRAITNAGGTIKGGPIVANDNTPAGQAAATAQAIYDQTKALQIPAGSAALFTQAQFTGAVAAAFASPVITSPVPATIIQPSNAEVVAAIQAQTVEVAAQTAVNQRGFELLIGKFGSSGGDVYESSARYSLPSALRNA